MGRIGERFARLRERGEKALVVFVTAGDPDLPTTEALLPALAEAGADVIELGVPFSDPIADGPSIQRSSERALRAGVSLRKVLQLVKQVRSRVEIPLVLMGYANVFLAMGEEHLVESAAAVGVDGTIVVDLPPEEGESLFAREEAAGIDPILLAAPTTTPERLALLAARTRGFLYYVSLTGVTGARAELAADVEAGVRRAVRACRLPVCVGFGISTPEQAARIAAWADGGVVGSAIVDRIGRAASPEEAIDAAVRFVAELKGALRASRPSSQ
jgi:tryptophan synthase alpha chain